MLEKRNIALSRVIYGDYHIDAPECTFDLRRALKRISELGFTLVVYKNDKYEAVLSFHGTEWSRSYKDNIIEAVIYSLFHACYEMEGLVHEESQF